MRACALLLVSGATTSPLLAQTTPNAPSAPVFTLLYSFSGKDGAGPAGGLVQATDGNLYGTTYYGGLCCGPNGIGTIFKVTSSGTLTPLHDFDGTDGQWPSAALVQGTDGDFYGTTSFGGANGIYGTVFKITATGTLTTLHSFDGTDGWGPSGGVIQATDGNFYGTTAGSATME